MSSSPESPEGRVVTMSHTEDGSAESEQFYAGALGRIRRFMLLLAAVSLAACLVWFRWPVAAGFAAGALVSYVNYAWLERVVEAVGERIVTGRSHERGGAIVARAVLRYAFVAVGAYVIFNVSLTGLYGFLGGVCLPIAAIACETAVELFVALRRGF